MTRLTLRAAAAPVLAIAFLVSGCESSEQRAADHYEAGLALLETGDTERAAIEFRNVFRFDGAHQDARRRLAGILLEQGDVSRAYGQYLRLAEQYPDLADARQALTMIAIEQNQWGEAERHGRLAVSLDPEAPLAPVIAVALDYRDAIEAEDGPARDAVAEEARVILAAADGAGEDEGGIRDEAEIARRIVITNHLENGALSSALAEIDAALELDPDSLDYNMLRLRVLASLDDADAIGAHLRAMQERFPDNAEIQQALISFYIEQEDIDGAEAFLRELAGDDAGPPEGHATVIRLLETWKGRDAALAETERLIEANADRPENAMVYRAIRAGYAFEAGDRSAAVDELSAVLEGAEPSEQTRRIKATLARMLVATGNRVGARALIEEILAEDETSVAALKLRAALQIEDDKPAEAIVDLRRALDQSPRDTETIMLLAEAHARNGSTALQGERLATAVEVSGSAPKESLAYAEYLIREGRTGAARSVLAEARNANPADVEILVRSARLAMQDGASGLVRGIVADLRRLPDDPRAAEAARSLEAAMLMDQDRVEDSLALLEENAGEAGQNARAVMAIVSTRLRNGNVEEARRYLDQVRAEAPDDPDLRLVDAGLTVAEGDAGAAEEILRDLVADRPQAEAPLQQLYRLLRTEGREADATAALDAGIERMPKSRALRLFKAGELERENRIDEAVAVYEEMYAENSGDVIVANNLASLLTSYADDDADLERAAAVARRLRGQSVPAFQDTYGWIAYRQGRLDDALDSLRPAAEGLPRNPLVHYHLGMTYAALDRTRDAVEALNRAIELGAGRGLPQIDIARETLASIEAGGAAGGTGDGGGDGTAAAIEDGGDAEAAALEGGGGEDGAAAVIETDATGTDAMPADGG